MILGILLLLGGMLCLVAALRRLRGPGDAAGAGATRLVIGQAPGQDAMRMLLHRGAGIAFGPHPVRWDPAGSLTASGTWRVAAAVDLSAEDALGTGDARLAGRLRGAVGQRALVLEPLSGGGRPVLLHAGGSAGGIGIKRAHLDALIALLGDPAGLQVELVRRRVQRAGWGVAQGQKRRARQ